MTQRLYYLDSFLREFPATVTNIREHSRQDGETLWQIALDRSAFYPTSGGQPYDTGTLRATSRNGAILEIPVLAVEEDESGEVWHSVNKPLMAGTQVEAFIDWPRRLDHMQQHSGQHLLSATLIHRLGAHTVSFHLGPELSTIDIDRDSLSPDDLTRIERVVNDLIAENRPLFINTVARADAEALLAAGELPKLPERDGTIRIIEIENYDRNACGGTHVHSTGQIGSLLIRSTEKVSRGLRLTYVAGLRAVSAARHDAELLHQAASLLTIGPDSLPEAIRRIQAESKSAAKENQKLRTELAHYHAARLAVEVPYENGIRWVHRAFDDRDPDYLRQLASALTAAAPHTVAFFSCREGDSARIVFARSRDLDFHCGHALRDALAPHNLRAGGSPDMAQSLIPAHLLDTLHTTLTTQYHQ